MAGEIFKVQIEELRSTAQAFKNYKAQMQIAYLEMSNAVRVVGNGWRGDASNEFQTRFNAMYKNLEQTEARVMDAVDNMSKAADLFYETENALSSIFANVETGRSPFDA